MNIEDLKIDIYADGADIDKMIEIYNQGFIKGFTTNPTLMRKAGVTDYSQFVRRVVDRFPDVPISFEVFSDEFDVMQEEALQLAQYGKNVKVKIPITNSKGISSIPLIKALSSKGVNLNVTAVFTIEQVKAALAVLNKQNENIISVFAGRIADTGNDPEIIMRQAVDICKEQNGVKILWASCREVFNIIQADRCGVDIITVTNDILGKLGNLGKDLEQFSLETVQMFERDGRRLEFAKKN